MASIKNKLLNMILLALMSARGEGACYTAATLLPIRQQSGTEIFIIEPQKLRQISYMRIFTQYRQVSFDLLISNLNWQQIFT